MSTYEKHRYRHEKRLKKPVVKTAELLSGLIISPGEARKLLGVESSHFTDEELAYQIHELTQFAMDLLKNTNLPEKQL